MREVGMLVLCLALGLVLIAGCSSTGGTSAVSSSDSSGGSAVGTGASSGTSTASSDAYTSTDTSSQATSSATPADAWQVKLTPYFWMAGLSGDVPVGDMLPISSSTTVSTDVSFEDIMDAFEFGFMGKLEVSKGKWGGYADIMYLHLSTDKAVLKGMGDVDLDFKMGIAELGLTYTLWEQPLGGSGGPVLSFDVLGGGRIWTTKAEIDLSTAGGSVGDGEDNWWIDPFVGLQARLALNEKWSLYARGDYGGFGIGSASDSTWQVMGGVDYRLSKHWLLTAGYRVLDVERSSGVSYQFSGPWLGVTVDF